MIISLLGDWKNIWPNPRPIKRLNLENHLNWTAYILNIKYHCHHYHNRYSCSSSVLRLKSPIENSLTVEPNTRASLMGVTLYRMNGKNTLRNLVNLMAKTVVILSFAGSFITSKIFPIFQVYPCKWNLMSYPVPTFNWIVARCYHYFVTVCATHYQWIIYSFRKD